MHMSAPPKGQTSDLFLEEMMNIVQQAAHRDICLDRSYYGESCIWPKVYDRESLLSEEGLEILRELEDTVGTLRILMHDPNIEDHWQRCVDNKEPLTKTQFIKARALYSGMADKYGFERKTLRDFPDVVSQTANKNSNSATDASSSSKTDSAIGQTRFNKDQILNKTKEQLKLEKANVINEVLSRRIIKGKGSIYDDLENSVRSFLNTELGKIFGSSNSQQNFSNEEVQLLKFFCQRLRDKENN